MTLSIDEAQFEKIVDTLAASTVHVPSGRRDIYLAMPAVLLNRGVPPDDVLAIIEEVSLRYPRQHAEKHADNLHCAQTTIDRWLAEGSAARITQIGTLQALAPEVAAALDEAVPDPLTKALTDTFNEEQETTPTPSTVLPRTKKRRRRKLSTLGRALAPKITELRQAEKPDRKIQGWMLERIVRGESLRTATSTPDQDEALVSRALETLGFHIDRDVSWQAALDEAGQTLLAMNFAQSTDRLSRVEKAFYEGRAHKHAAEHREKIRNAKRAQEKLNRRTAAFNALSELVRRGR